MTKRVHPNASFKGSAPSSDSNVAKPRLRSSSSCGDLERSSNGSSSSSSISKDECVALTVWKKSLLMNCKGFTVFDSSGNIVFRVDNYVAANRGEIVLMDADGRPLLTIRRKRLSWGDNWLVYDGESSVNPRYLVRKQGGLLVNTNTMSLAHVLGTSSSKAQNTKNGNDKSLIYNIEGSYAQRNVTVYNKKRQCVAEIKKKEAPAGGANLGGDVFKLIVVRNGDIGCAEAMALVILLDQMFGSS